MSPAHKLLEMIHGSWIAQAVYVTSELRIADLLAGGPRTSEDLAAAAGVHGPSLHRLLRALTTIDICREREDGSFEMTPTGRLLQTDAPDSLRHWTMWWGNNLWPVWGNLLYSVKTGKSARTLLQGTEGFGHLEKDPQTAMVFNRALAELTTLTSQSVVAAYDFSGIGRIVDVGGGFGQLLAAILKANPSASGLLFDLPHAAEGARNFLNDAGLAGRCDVAAGDFFESVPAGGDAYIIKSVLHDWNEERCSRILSNCRRAMGRGARLLVVERIVPARLEQSSEHQSLARTDLTMLAALAAQERSEEEFCRLLDSAGFEVCRILPAGMTVSIIEALAR